VSEAVNLVGQPVARAIYNLVRDENNPKCLSSISENIRDTSKQTIAKYLGEMELLGILRAEWVQGTDSRWRRCYSKGNTEWSRLFDRVIELEKTQKKD
jgi:hypothetical protein